MQHGPALLTIEPDLDGLLRSFLLPNIRHLVSRKRAHGGRFELFIAEVFPGRSDSNRRPGKHVVKLDTKYQQAARHTDQQKINPDTDAGPKMNLEKRAPRPHALRTAPQPCKNSESFAHRKPSTCALGFKRTSRPTK